MIDAEFMAEREDAIRPDEAPAVDTSTPDAPETDSLDMVAQDAGSPDEGSSDAGFAPPDDGEAAPPPVVGMTSDPDGEELPPIVEADPTFDAETGFQLTLDPDDLSLPGLGFTWDNGLFF